MWNTQEWGSLGADVHQVVHLVPLLLHQVGGEYRVLSPGEQSWPNARTAEWQPPCLKVEPSIKLFYRGQSDGPSMYCPRCDRTIKGKNLDEVNKELKEKFDQDSLERWRLPGVRHSSHRPVQEEGELMRLDELTSTEFKQIMKKRPIVFLPIGGNRGPLLPPCPCAPTPCSRSSSPTPSPRRIGGLVAPPLRYAFHSSTRNMPGTIGLGFETTIRVVRDILGSLVTNGADKLVVISGHAGRPT